LGLWQVVVIGNTCRYDSTGAVRARFPNSTVLSLKETTLVVDNRLMTRQERIVASKSPPGWKRAVRMLVLVWLTLMVGYLILAYVLHPVIVQ
jgi:hypothetical protein